MHVGRYSSAGLDGGPSSYSCTSPTICTDAQSAVKATPDGIRGSLPSSASCRSKRFYTSLLRAVRSARVVVLKYTGRSGDGDGESTHHWSEKFGLLPLPCAASRWLHAWYEALVTTRVCAALLPQESGGPLVVHLALLLASLEVVQAASFYLRFRRVKRASAEAAAGTIHECDKNVVNAAGASDFSISPYPSATQAPSPPAMESVPAGRSHLPGGLSQAMRRLCNYWALIERAVQAAPRKRAGTPTNVAELGRFSGSEFPVDGSTANSGDGRARCRFTVGGALRGADRALVLSEEAAFPVLSEKRGDSKKTPSAVLPIVSTLDDVPLTAGHSTDAALPTATEKPAEVAEPWKVMHLLWTDMVRYSVAYDELRQLLLGCTAAEIAKVFENSGDAESFWGNLFTARGTRVPPSTWGIVDAHDAMSEGLTNTIQSTMDFLPHPSAADSSTGCVTSPTTDGTPPCRYADPRVAVPCVALAWYLSLVREVYEAVIVYEDVHRCADALRELEAFGTAVYQHGIEVGAAFFEETLRSASRSGVEGASGSSDHAADANGEHPFGHPQSYAHPAWSPEAVSTADGDAENVVVGSTASMGASAHLGVRRESHESTPLCCDAGNSPLVLLSSPRCCEEGLPAAEKHARVRGVLPRVCWAELTAALAVLLRRRRRLELLHVRRLFSYMYTGSVAKVLSFTVLTALTCLSSRVAAVGKVAREAISTDLDKYCRVHGGLSLSGSDDDSGSGPCGGGGVTGWQRILALCWFECMRLAVNTVLTRTTHEYITIAASQRRNTVKAELYEALTRLPLAFFDLHSFGEVEQMVYYVNDIEGVEVHVHRYVCGLVRSLLAMKHAMHQLPLRARLLVGATVAVSLTVKSIGRRMTQRIQAAQRSGRMLPQWLCGCHLNGATSAAAELDAEVEENSESNARQGGVMLRGLDIVAMLPQLRPYSADLRLMRWWTDHTRACGATAGATATATLLQGLQALPFQAYGKLLPALGGSLMSFADWVLPTLVASYGASMAFSSAEALSLSNRLIDALRCVGDTVDAVIDGGRVVELVLLNAYKANAVQTLLDARCWEPTTAEYARSAALSGEVDSCGRDHIQSRDAGASYGPRAAQVRAPQYNRWHHLLRSLCRPNSPTAEVGPLSLTARCMHVLKHHCCWCAGHAPHVPVLGGCLRLARRGLARVGLVKACCCGKSGRESQKLYRHRRPHEARHISRWRKDQPPQEVSQRLQYCRARACGSACGETGVCLSNHSSEGDSGCSVDTGPSRLPFSDDTDAKGEAAAGAVTALKNATVHAVTVKNLQFYYPTAPTVPVFPRPITCSFVLQGTCDASASSPSSASRRRTVRSDCDSRGRLVCLVGPSGHGKSTLLSLLLGMYTNYGVPSHTLSDNSDADRGGGDREERQEGGGTAGKLPCALSSPAGISDIVLTLALPRSPPYSAEELGLAGSHDATSASTASAIREVAHVQRPVSSIPRDILRGDLFSFVPQSPVIFSGATIAHNISLENRVSLEQEGLLSEIAQCAAWAHCEYIQRFPQGLMTYIADSGTGAWSSPLETAATGGGGDMVRLSIGQAQRLMVARALFHGRRGGTVLVMDEPTASLDKEVKFKMLKEWRELLDRGIVRGAICATHDDDLIAAADEVVRLP
ncbi:hypothetical protein LSCM4_07681 [Leishmania orientalis]|uniref:AAA+ ATPase domain-containing protein n=1 Tax=Leishmania orientalis TaxID=2249476 RepID=A0A836HP11_9TRYP|nr:hypothetical protein LSCM4_07681 [Leishmania orientalis]